MSQIALLPVKPGSLKSSDKAKLSKAGIIVIEHDNPSELRLIAPGHEIDAGELLLAAMRGVMRDHSAKAAFAENFTKFLESAWERKRKTP